MVFVCLGTQDMPFTRLLEMVESCIQEGNITQPVKVQCGYTTYPSDRLEQFAFCSAEQMHQYMEEADYIITHAGTGTIVSALKLGKKVIAVNRLHRFGEHTDDHQKEIVAEFASTGYILSCYEEEHLADKIAMLDQFAVPVFESNTHVVLDYLRNYIDDVLGRKS